MNVCDQMTPHFLLLITFPYSVNQSQQLSKKKFFDWKHGLGCDEMNICDQMTAYFVASVNISLLCEPN
jgi:hypothetical protein